MTPSKNLVDIEAIDVEKKTTLSYLNDIRDLVVSYLVAESNIISLMKTKTDVRYWLHKSPK